MKIPSSGFVCTDCGLKRGKSAAAASYNCQSMLYVILQSEDKRPSYLKDSKKESRIITAHRFLKTERSAIHLGT